MVDGDDRQAQPEGEQTAKIAHSARQVVLGLVLVGAVVEVGELDHDQGAAVASQAHVARLVEERLDVRGPDSFGHGDRVLDDAAREGAPVETKAVDFPVLAQVPSSRSVQHERAVS